MHTFFVSVFLLIVTLLTGCSTAPVEKVVVKTELHVIKTPASLLKKCDAKSPPAKDDYLKLNYRQKEDALVKYSNDLLTDLAMCNNQISRIAEFQDKEEKNLLTVKGNK